MEKSSLQPSKKKLRHSERVTTITPEKDTANVDKLLTGKPPNGARMWCKEALIEVLLKLEGTKKAKEFLRKVLKVGKTEYKTEGGIYKMFRAWKETKEVPRREGRPSTMETTEAEATVKQVLKDCSHNSSTFQLQHMKDAFERKRKE